MNYYNLLNNVKDESKKCIIVNDTAYTYHWVKKHVSILEEKINKSINVCRKEIVAIFDKNIYFQFIAFFALNKAQVIPIIFHPSTPYNEVKKIMEVNHIKYILSSEGVKEIENIHKEETISKKYELYKCVNAVLTSGSTGLPKVLYRTYESWAVFFHIQNEVFKVNKDTVMFFHGPLSFTGNLNSILSVIYEGGTIVTYEGFDPKSWHKLIVQNKVNTMYLVPAKINVLNKVIKAPITSITSIFTGSQQLFGSLMYDMKKYYCNANIILYYGASELNYITYISLDDLLKKPMSLGKPFHNVYVKEKDGFIYVNSKYFAMGFDKWSTVKDVGYIDEWGEVIFNGRENDVINKGGNTINLNRILDKINNVPYVTSAYVTSYNDKYKEKEIAAFIEVNKNVLKGDFKKTLSKELLNYEMPKKVFILDKMPINDSGKIDRRFLDTKFKLI